MGNSLPQLSVHRSLRASKTKSPYPSLKKSRSLREYARNTNNCFNSNNSHNRRNITFSRPQSLPPTDAEIIDIHALRCRMSTSNVDEGEHQLLKQLDYIHSCVRKDKGLFGKKNTFSLLLDYSICCSNR